MSLLRPLSNVFRAVATAPTIRLLNPILNAAAGGANPTHLSTAHRSKHSATQVKRLFKNNPARLRLLKKKGNLPAPNKQIPDPLYPPVFKPEYLSNGWSAPPPPDVHVPDYPFKVTRTGRKPFGAVGFLPVYRDVRIHGTKQTTIIRNVSGNIPAFVTELRAVLSLPLGKKGVLTSASTGKHGGGEAGRGVNKQNPIRIRTGGAIEVNGDRALEVRIWLSGLGF
mmetsp:Transcript_23515/g.50316  ORF Transcript_23515/g.50316 Transcript_23515/m.50316 type:complete len:224 (+) Transcript_23515:181-852(+)|eukprot:CAMPEP_0172531982 /NCGR_PEP_ID=MMETSP1067-20121228/5196_1 /TAXON_ID=265564 ORGANISM="Thalassiosira punctigera, Strain Tpunct2005C2" /NCGR_SAMPLE_ID=MMETSP1067 /ASSEMBLY_ACC=CAM_ASM_000444 /LENGTH=223 /DNA_ID=CAMNT_0013316435 /DNA_START=159 /DNA_END=830 /DNA_ORIENTATION=-